MEKRIGISTCAMQWNFGNKAALEMAARTGAQSVDFDLNVQGVNYLTEGSVYAQGEDAIREYFTEIKNYATSLGLEIYQTHSKCDGFGTNDARNAELDELHRLDLLATSALGAKVCIFHAPTNLPNWRAIDRARMDALHDAQFLSIAKNAKKYGVLAATETFGTVGPAPVPTCEYYGGIKAFEAAYRRIAESEWGDAFVVCVDSGHSNLAMRFGNPSPADIVRIFGDKVKALHLHDNLQGFDEHCLPLNGFVDFFDLFRALDEVGYDGVYNLEVNFNMFGPGFLEETATFAVRLLRRMLDHHEGKIAW